MENKIVNHLLFTGSGKAEEAMNFYVSLFADSKIVNVERYTAGEGNEISGTVKLARFTLNGQMFQCADSNAPHAFTFNPAISFFVKCSTENEIDNLYEKFAQNGQVLMELGTYPFSKKFCWVQDRFGISWQLSLAE